MAMCRPRRIDSMVNGPWSPASGTGRVGAGGGGRLSVGRGLSAEPAIAVVVQRMVDTTRSGVMFSADRSGTVVGW